MGKNETLKIIYKSVSELTPYANNPRKNDAAVDAVAASIKEFGFKVPIVIDKKGTIAAGHTRLKAAKKLGFEEKNISEGQPFVILENNKLERLINLFPDSTERKLAARGRIKTHVSGNKTWIKKLTGTNGTNGTL